MKCSCWFWNHKWGKWSELVEGKLTYFHGGSGAAYFQQRACTVCNLKQVRQVI